MQAQWWSSGIAVLAWVLDGVDRKETLFPLLRRWGPMSAMDDCCPGHNKWLFRLRHPVSVSVETEDKRFGHVMRLRMTKDGVLCW